MIRSFFSLSGQRKSWQELSEYDLGVLTSCVKSGRGEEERGVNRGKTSKGHFRLNTLQCLMPFCN